MVWDKGQVTLWQIDQPTDRARSLPARLEPALALAPSQNLLSQLPLPSPPTPASNFLLLSILLPLLLQCPTLSQAQQNTDPSRAAPSSAPQLSKASTAPGSAHFMGSPVSFSPGALTNFVCPSALPHRTSPDIPGTSHWKPLPHEGKGALHPSLMPNQGIWLQTTGLRNSPKPPLTPEQPQCLQWGEGSKGR